MSSTPTVGQEKSSIVQVIRPYPIWIEPVIMGPDLGIGPAQFDVAELEHWLAPGQGADIVRGHAIYKVLRAEEALPSCLSIFELEAIQRQGIGFYQQYFAGKAIFAWRSLGKSQCDLYVPYAVEAYSEVVVCWRSLSSVFDSSNPALRFRK